MITNISFTNHRNALSSSSWLYRDCCIRVPRMITLMSGSPVLRVKEILNVVSYETSGTCQARYVFTLYLYLNVSVLMLQLPFQWICFLQSVKRTMVPVLCANPYTCCSNNVGEDSIFYPACNFKDMRAVQINKLGGDAMSWWDTCTFICRPG